MIITRDWIMTNRTKHGAWTRSQIEALGLTWRPNKGWISRLEGNEISNENRLIFEARATAKQSRKSLTNYDLAMSAIDTLKPRIPLLSDNQVSMLMKALVDERRSRDLDEDHLSSIEHLI